MGLHVTSFVGMLFWGAGGGRRASSASVVCGGLHLQVPQGPVSPSLLQGYCHPVCSSVQQGGFPPLHVVHNGASSCPVIFFVCVEEGRACETEAHTHLHVMFVCQYLFSCERFELVFSFRCLLSPNPHSCRGKVCERSRSLVCLLVCLNICMYTNVCTDMHTCTHTHTHMPVHFKDVPEWPCAWRNVSAWQKSVP